MGGVCGDFALDDYVSAGFWCASGGESTEHCQLFNVLYGVFVCLRADVSVALSFVGSQLDWVIAGVAVTQLVATSLGGGVFTLSGYYAKRGPCFSNGFGRGAFGALWYQHRYDSGVWEKANSSDIISPMSISRISPLLLSPKFRPSPKPRVLKVLYVLPSGEAITRNDTSYLKLASPVTSAKMPEKVQEKLKLKAEPERIVLQNFRELEAVSSDEGEFFILGGNLQGLRTVAQHNAKRWIQSQSFYNARLSQTDRLQAEARDTGKSFSELLKQADTEVAVRRYATPGHLPAKVGTILAEQHLSTLRSDDFSRKELTGPFGQINLLAPHFMVANALDGRLPDLLLLKLDRKGDIKKVLFEKA